MPDVVRRQRCVNVTMYAITGNALSHLVINSIYNFHRTLHRPHLQRDDDRCWPAVRPSTASHRREHGVNHHAGARAAGIPAWSLSLGLESEPAHLFHAVAGGHAADGGRPELARFACVLVLSSARCCSRLNFAPVERLRPPQKTGSFAILSSHAMINTMVDQHRDDVLRAGGAQVAPRSSLRSQYERSEALIQTVMPQPIAERLKSGDSSGSPTGSRC